MSLRTWTIAAVAVLVPAALAAVLLSQKPAPAPAPAAQAATSVAAAVAATSGAVDAQKAHARLLAAAEQLQPPVGMPTPVAHSAGLDQARAVAALEQPQQAAPAPVDDARQVTIAFTSNVIGETDPCG